MAFTNSRANGNTDTHNSNSIRPAATKVPFRDRPKAYGWKNTNDRGYTIDETPSGTGRRLRVIGVGAGASGINLAKVVRDDLKDVEVVVYDKNPVQYQQAHLCPESKAYATDRKLAGLGGRIDTRMTWPLAK